MKRSITVLVADDHVGLAAALTQSLGRRFLTEGSVNTPQQLRGAMREWRAREGWRAGPLVVLLDIHFGEQAESGLELLADLVVTCPEARYVMHSLYGSRVFVHQALALGAIGFVDKCCGLTEMEKAIEAAAASRVAVYTKEDVGGGAGAGRATSLPSTPPGASAGVGTPAGRSETRGDRGDSRRDALGGGIGHHETASCIRGPGRRGNRLARVQPELVNCGVAVVASGVASDC